MSVLTAQCGVCSAAIDTSMGFCSACGYVASSSASAAPTELRVEHGRCVVRLEHGDGTRLLFEAPTIGESLTASEDLVRRGVTFLRDEARSVASPELAEVGTPNVVAVLPSGALLSTDLSESSPRERLVGLLGLARLMERARREQLLWLDLSPDLVWRSGSSLYPIAVWRVARLDLADSIAGEPWSGACSPPECALGQPASASSPLFSWARLTQQLVAPTGLPSVWCAVLQACLRSDPLERLASLEDVLDELEAALEPTSDPADLEGAWGRVVGGSDRGPLRPEQEDRWTAWVDTDGARGLAAVADGMGGGVLGGLAAEWALAGLVRAAEAPGDIVEACRQAILATSRRIQRFREALQLLECMGTTVVALIWEGSTRSVLHVGDSRAYRAPSGAARFERETQDHAPVDGGATGGVTNAVDGGEVHVEMSSWQAIPVGERWLLCSDGFWSPAESVGLLDQAAPEDVGDPKQLLTCVRESEEEQLSLLQTADNATVVLVELAPPPEGRKEVRE